MNNNTNNTNNQYICLLTLNIVELTIHLLATLPISLLNFFLILQTSILHPNLKFILLCQSFCIFCRSFGRIIVILSKFISFNILYGGPNEFILLFGFAAYFRNFLAHVLVIERSLATYNVKKYENWKKPYFSFIWFPIVCILALLNSLNSISSIILNLTTWSVVLILAILEIGIFTWLWHYNDKTFQNQLFIKHSLTERYQLVENIRTAKQLTPTLLIHFLNILIGTLINWAFYIKIFGTITDSNSKIFYYGLLDILFYITIAITNFAIELTMILNHPYLRRNFLLLFFKIKYSIFKIKNISNGRIGPTTNVYFYKGFSLQNNENNKIINNDSKSETEKHFEQLKRNWEICLKPKKKI